MRHGEAEPPAGSDAGRCLTGTGRAEVQASVRAAMYRGVDPSHVVTSPLVRAGQTAQMVVRLLSFSGAVEIWDALAPDGECQVVTSRLESMAGAPLLVSHQPLVGRLIEYLCCVEVAMPTAALACVRYEFPARGCASLEWIVHP